MQVRKTLYLWIGLAWVLVIGVGCSASVTPPSSARHAPVVTAKAEQRSVRVYSPLPTLAKTAHQTTQASRDSYQRSMARAYASLKDTAEGKNADYIPALAKVDPKLFGIALATVDGAVYEIGSARHEFSIQSVSKIFTLAKAIEQLGADVVEKRIGVSATGMPFNSITAIELNKEGTPAMNPLVNPGAIATVDALLAVDSATKWNIILGTYSAFAARPLGLNQEVYKSESETNTRNRAIGTLLQAYEVVKGDVSTALDLYTRQCSVNVTARDLAIMGATLANGGTNPLTNQKVVDADTAERVLAVMATAGLYEATGQWMYEVSVPAKSGVGGGIVAVVPGRFAIGTFAPPLDKAGNSVKGQLAVEAIVKDVGGGVFASFPVARKLGTAGGH